tara:strand:+ start:56 stop:1204 length:1149 start_codon:yes stop_codon:yes gene_type:complete
MKVIDNIITDSINEKSQQVFTESDIIIFFNKDELIKNLTNHWWWTSDASCYRKMKDVERKMKKKNIDFYYYSADKLKTLDNKFKFNDHDNIPKFNELYFKLKDYNPDKIRYYTYNNYIRTDEDYKYDYIVNLFTKFGLEFMSWSYCFSNDNKSKKSKKANLGVKDNNIEVGIDEDFEIENSTKMLGSKEFTNIGAIDFFNSCDRRVFWYTYCAKDINEVVKEILKNSDYYFYEYYQNCNDLQAKLKLILKGAIKIKYTFEKDDSSRIAINKMLKISNKYGGFGFKMNNEVVNNNSYNKKYSIKFYKTEELEKTTLENIIWNEKLQTENINMESVNKRYSTLSVNDVSELRKQNNKLQELINMKTKTLQKSYGVEDIEISYTT